MTSKLSILLLEIGSRVLKITPDIGGHFKGEDISKFVRGHVATAFLDDGITYAEARNLLAVMDGKKEPSSWVRLTDSNLFRCGECGQKVSLEFNGKELRCINPCQYPNGIEPYSVELNVPSGKFVVTNNLRDVFKVSGNFDVMSAHGRMLTTQHYADAGMVHAFVGNTCPGFYKITSGKFVIGNTGGQGESPVSRAVRVAGITTDLWWYSVADHDEFIKRAGANMYALVREGRCYEVVKCKPGVYRFRHAFQEGKKVFTKIDCVRKPDAVRNMGACYDNLNLTAGQVILDSINECPQLFRCKNTTDSIQRAADHLMCVLGNGAEYHPNGFLNYRPTVTNDAPGIDIPVFKKKYHWYPFDIDSIIGTVAGLNDSESVYRCFPESMGGGSTLNPSFVSLAFNICHCIAKYGADSDEKLQEMGQRCLVGLAERYPAPNYIKRFLKTTTP